MSPHLRYQQYLMKTILPLFILAITLQQDCLNFEGNKVSWWAILKVPPKVGSSGFGYIDSTSASSSFAYFKNYVDQGSTPLTRTELQINQNQLQTIAWNDEKPTGQVSTTRAHSKGFLAFSFEKKRGFLVSHSVPKYPAFDGDRIITTIAPAENYYGQNLFCISMSLSEMDKLASKLMTIHLYVYYSSVKDGSATHNLYQLGKQVDTTPPQNFQFEQFNPSSGIGMKGIFKNGGGKNCSIFEDGMISYLKETLTAETWGRPLEKSWCHSPYSVLNVVRLQVGSIQWTEQDDHSKWVVSNNYGCFGDMNRMDSQWKRGGSFFCLQNQSLVKALTKVIIEAEKCQVPSLRSE